MKRTALTVLAALGLATIARGDSRAPWQVLYGKQFNTVATGILHRVVHNADTLLFHRNELSGREFWAIHDWGAIEIREILLGSVDTTHVEVTWFVKSHHVSLSGEFTPVRRGVQLEGGMEGIWLLNMGGSRLNGRRRFVYLPMDSLGAVLEFIKEKH
jgi:hypothetical protein